MKAAQRQHQEEIASLNRRRDVYLWQHLGDSDKMENCRHVYDDMIHSRPEHEGVSLC